MHSRLTPRRRRARRVLRRRRIPASSRRRPARRSTTSSAARTRSPTASGSSSATASLRLPTARTRSATSTPSRPSPASRTSGRADLLLADIDGGPGRPRLARRAPPRHLDGRASGAHRRASSAPGSTSAPTTASTPWSSTTSTTSSGRDGALDAGDDLALAELLIERAHDAGLAVGQKNAAELVGDGAALGFDFAITESCQVFDECEEFLAAYGSAVIEVEYAEHGDDPFDAACAARGDEISIVRRDETSCRPTTRRTASPRARDGCHAKPSGPQGAASLRCRRCVLVRPS